MCSWRNLTHSRNEAEHAAYIGDPVPTPAKKISACCLHHTTVQTRIATLLLLAICAEHSSVFITEVGRAAAGTDVEGKIDGNRKVIGALVEDSLVLYDANVVQPLRQKHVVDAQQRLHHPAGCPRSLQVPGGTIGGVRVVHRAGSVILRQVKGIAVAHLADKIAGAVSLRRRCPVLARSVVQDLLPLLLGAV